MWAYKDVMVTVLALNVNSSSAWRFEQFFCNSMTDLLRTCTSTGVNVIIAILATTFTYLVNCGLFYFHYGYAVDVDKEQRFAEKWLTACPMSLGVGLAWRAVVAFPLQIFPEACIVPQYTMIFKFVAYLIRNFIFTHIIVYFMKSYATRVDRLAMPKDPLKRTFSQFASEEWYRCFIKSLPFVFAWLWSDFVNFCTFTVSFGCPDGKPVCPGETTKQVFIQLYVALGLTLAGSTLLPWIRSSSAKLARVEGAFVHYFMPNDAEAVKSQKMFGELVTAFFGISIGWAWTALAASECSLDFSPTCPATFSFIRFVLFALMVSIYILVAGAVYHLMMRSFRLGNRCNLALEIQDGNGKRIFAELDADKNGRLDWDELTGYFQRAGLNEEPFTHAFHDLANHTDGVVDGTVTMDDLMAHFKELMVQVFEGTYHPDESIALQLIEKEAALQADMTAEMGIDADHPHGDTMRRRPVQQQSSGTEVEMTSSAVTNPLRDGGRQDGKNLVHVDL